MSDERVAIISDIHSNIWALEAVLSDIKKLGVERIICLGDIIGYGPAPREVIKRAIGWEFCLQGNHENALLFRAYDFNYDAYKVICWTRSELNSAKFPENENFAIWNFLGGLKEKKEDDNIMFVHGSPNDPIREYIMPSDVEKSPEKMTKIFSLIKWGCFCGHTHIPGVFTSNLKFLMPSLFASGIVRLRNEEKFIINVGSVGQPRDLDIRASYVIFTGETCEFRRVDYDYKLAASEIRKIKEISPHFADRLEVGR